MLMSEIPELGICFNMHLTALQNIEINNTEEYGWVRLMSRNTVFGNILITIAGVIRFIVLTTSKATRPDITNGLFIGFEI